MNIIQASFVLFLTYLLSLKLGKYFKIDQTKTTVVFVFRTIICIIYISIAKNLDFDAYGYYVAAYITESSEKFFTTGLIFTITRFLREYFYLNIYSVTFLFSFIGNIGILALISNIKTFTKNIRGPLKSLSELVIFFPTLNIWTSAIGKDPITFACINLVIYALINIRSRIYILLISSIVFCLVRPFLGIVLLFALTISFTKNSNLSTLKKLFLGILSFVGIITFNFFNSGLNKFVWLDFFNIDFDLLSQGIKYYSDTTSTGNNAIQLSTIPLPLKLFSFMFRPLFFDARDLFSLLMSFENIVILLIFLFLVIYFLKFLKTNLLNLSSLNIFLKIYLTVSWLFYSLTVANLGTANRYKLMFLPALISLSLIFADKSKSSIIKKI